MMENSIADRLFDGTHAETSLEGDLYDAGVHFEKLGWDFYDCSLEIYGVAADYRLSPEAQKIIHEAGFIKAYVNHVDKWETHYGFKPSKKFKATKGWRVSYPHKRGEGEKEIWVEGPIATWPKSWFKSGYVVIKKALTTPSHSQ